MEKKRYKRKKLNLKVKRDLQFWILKRTLIPTLLGIAVGLFILYVFSYRELEESFYRAHLTIRRVSDLLLPVIILSGLTSFLASLVLIIFFPQKIAGPIYRLERDLCGHLKDGDLTFVFRLRRDDPFQTLPKAINEAVASIREKVRNAYLQLEEARRLLEEGKVEEAKSALEAVSEFVKKELKF